MKNEWISTKEKLPQEWQKVLILHLSGDMDVVTFRSGKFERKFKERINIAFWMPLPEFPDGFRKPQ